ncbi:MAG: hypothetical protein ABWZ98_11230 [Nakamurella sp.]
MRPTQSPVSQESISAMPLAELLRLIAGRAEEAMREFYEQTSALVYTQSLLVVGDPRRAERITAQVFLDVWWRVAEYDPSTGTVGSWLELLTRARLIEDLKHGRAERPARTAVRTETGSTVEGWVRNIRRGGAAMVGSVGVPASAA